MNFKDANRDGIVKRCRDYILQLFPASQEMIDKQACADEFNKCAADPEYFYEHYWKPIKDGQVKQYPATPDEAFEEKIVDVMMEDHGHKGCPVGPKGKEGVDGEEEAIKIGEEAYLKMQERAKEVATLINRPSVTPERVMRDIYAFLLRDSYLENARQTYAYELGRTKPISSEH